MATQLPKHKESAFFFFLIYTKLLLASISWHLCLMRSSKNSRIVWSGKTFCFQLNDTPCNLVEQNSVGWWSRGKHPFSWFCETIFWFIKMGAKKDNSLPDLCFMMLRCSFYSLKLKESDIPAHFLYIKTVQRLCSFLRLMGLNVLLGFYVSSTAFSCCEVSLLPFIR